MMMKIKIGKKKKLETCQACGKIREYNNWNFPIIWDVCRSCTIDGIIWAVKKALKEKEGE